MLNLKYFILLLTFSGTTLADKIPQGLGLIYGKDHIFSLKAPKQWILDNESAASSGVHAVFYKEGGSWEQSEVIAYARSRPITEKIKTVEHAVAFLIKDFHNNGNPQYKGQKIAEVETKVGKKGIIYHFTGDQWGSFEAVCYFKEKKTINMVILSSRNKQEFDASQKAFLSLSQSYKYIGDQYIKK